MQLGYDPTKVYGPNHCHTFSGRRMKAVDAMRRVQVVGFIRRSVHPGLMLDLMREITADRELWWVKQHMTWGLMFRNFLRDNKFGEKELGITNLDDYYIGFIELAVMGDEWYDDVPESDA